MKVLLLVLSVLGAGFLLAAPASAHATVVTSDPRDGTRVASAPKVVTIVFDEAVSIGQVGYLHVTDQTGKRVDAGAAFHPGGDGTKVSDTLTTGLGDGTYTGSFRVISADSHPVAGSIRFVVGNGPLARGTVAAAAGNTGSGAVLDIARWISYAGLALLGGAWLLLTVWAGGRAQRRARRIVWTGWAALTLGAAAELVLQGPYSAGKSPASAFDRALLDTTLHTDYGQLHCVRLVLLGLVAFALSMSLAPDARPARWEALLLPGAVGVAYTFSAAGHAAATSPSWLSIVADMAHLLAMATWIGGLIMLAAVLMPRAEPSERTAVLPVFSTAAFTSVVVLAVTGTYAAWRGIGTWDAILQTDYGLLVLGKITLFCGLLALGYVSRRIVQQRLVRGRHVAYAMTDTVTDTIDPAVETERLRRSVTVEAVIGLLVLALSAVLVAQPRGEEDLAVQYREPVHASAVVDSSRSLRLSADPGVHGTVQVTIDFVRGTPPPKLTVSASNDAKQLGPLPITMTQESDGSYDGSIDLPVSGTWKFGVLSTFSAFDAVLTTVQITLH